MGRKPKKSVKQDFSSFMSVLIMTIGCLTILLVANTLIIASNPDNLSITSVFNAADGEQPNMRFANSTLEPVYIDVHPNHLIIYPGEETVSAADLEVAGNPFQVWLDRVDRFKDRIYFVLLARPRSAILERKLESTIRSRGIDLGVELYETDKEVIYKSDKMLMDIINEESADTELLETSAEDLAGGEEGAEGEAVEGEGELSEDADQAAEGSESAAPADDQAAAPAEDGDGA